MTAARPWHPVAVTAYVYDDAIHVHCPCGEASLALQPGRAETCPECGREVRATILVEVRGPSLPGKEKDG